MGPGTGIAISRLCSRHQLLLRSLVPASAPASAPLLVIQRSYKFKRSFLSDEEGVDNFIALLGQREKKLLLDGLNKHMTDETTVAPEDMDSQEPPSTRQLRLVFVHQMLPFIGFGFLDNLIMILAGEYLDLTIGVTLGISTMAAAGLGNALSDVAGIGSAWYVEKLASQVGIEHPHLSKSQLGRTSTKVTTQMGRAIGILVGCIIGMFPLLFMHNKRSDDPVDHVKQESPAPKSHSN